MHELQLQSARQNHMTPACARAAHCHRRCILVYGAERIVADPRPSGRGVTGPRAAAASACRCWRKWWARSGAPARGAPGTGPPASPPRRPAAPGTPAPSPQEMRDSRSSVRRGWLETKSPTMSISAPDLLESSACHQLISCCARGCCSGERPESLMNHLVVIWSQGGKKRRTMSVSMRST